MAAAISGGQGLQGASGALTYAWHGDPARGCAVAGVCGLRGSVTILPDGDSGSGGSGDGPSGLTVGHVSASSATVRVLRADSGLPLAVCVDSLSSVDLVLRRERAGAVERPLDGSGGALPSSGRCAGPTAQDLARVHLPLRRFGAGFDLTGRRPFTAGAFSGEVISTLQLRPSGGGSGTGFTNADQPVRAAAVTSPRITARESSVSAARARRPRRVLVESVALRYRIASPSGALQTAFTGQGPPGCEQLDACGVNGTLTIGLSAGMRRFDVTASREVPRRVGAHRALADLHAGRLGLEPHGLHSTARETLSETLTRQTGSPCQSALSGVPIELDIDPGYVSSLVGGSGLGVILGGFSSSSQGIDPLRTRCPGPSQVDALSTQYPANSGYRILATAKIGRSSLGARRIVVRLGGPTSRFTASGYAGASSGSIVLPLELLRTRAGTHSETR